MKNIHLCSPMSKEKISAIASETLKAGGQVDPPLAEPKIGDQMPDGTIFAGISPETNQPMYAPSSDAPLTYTFNEAKAYAKKLDEDGHQDWRVPTKAELNLLFNNRAAIGGFCLAGDDLAGWYWSSSPAASWGAWAQRFSDGSQGDSDKTFSVSLRCVR